MVLRFIRIAKVYSLSIDVRDASIILRRNMACDERCELLGPGPSLSRICFILYVRF